MRKLLATSMLALTTTLVGCADFVDEDGNTSFRQVAEGLQSLGDRMAELGEAIERDADVEAVPWVDLREVIPEEINGASAHDVDGDDASDRRGAGLSMAGAKYAVRGDSMFVGVADLGALRSGAQLALRWVAPVFARGELDGDIEEITVDGHPGIRIRGDGDRRSDGGVLVALLYEGRFAVVAGSNRGANEDLVYDALEDVDYRRLRRWADYGTP
jgi:hypothetical protein